MKPEGGAKMAETNGNPKMDAFRAWTKDVGFPIVVAGILLWSMVDAVPKQVASLADAIREEGQRNHARLMSIEQQQNLLLREMARLLERRNAETPK